MLELEQTGEFKDILWHFPDSSNYKICTFRLIGKITKYTLKMLKLA